jgi:hypothetical protein
LVPQITNSEEFQRLGIRTLFDIFGVDAMEAGILDVILY